MPRPTRTIPAVLAVAFLVPSALQAQIPRGAGEISRVRAIEIGAKVGLESRNNNFILGVHARMPVDPWKRLEIMPGAWANRQAGITEYQFDADAALMLDSRGAFYAGGGAAFRNTVYEFDVEGEAGPREFRTGYNIFVGLRSPPGRRRELGVQLEARWVKVEDFSLQLITVGANWPVVIF